MHAIQSFDSSARTRAVAHPELPLIKSACMVDLYQFAQRAARTSFPVLIRGETGSGKELVARLVHDAGPRSRGPFVALNCATIPSTLLESALFGHERGAFTGAERQAPGVFEQAQGGSVFLDEVGELSSQAQAALLRVLEERRVTRLGSAREVAVDVRFVAATHRDLSAMVRAGAFRQDLLFRLDTIALWVPPLRKRVEEIVPLAELFLRRAREGAELTAECISKEAQHTLRAYHWPGNVRQLKSTIERAAVMCTSTVLQREHLRPDVCADALLAHEEPSSRLASRSLPERVNAFEASLIRDALLNTHGNQAQAARMLGVARRTLSNKIHAYGLLEVPCSTRARECP